MHISKYDSKTNPDHWLEDYHLTMEAKASDDDFAIEARRDPQEYIQRFSKKRNELPNITDADIINTFTYGMTSEALIHALNRETLRMMWELLDVAT